MKLFLISALLLIFSNSVAQFAIVKDKDGFVNIREAAIPNSKVVDKLQNGHLIYCFESAGNWTSIDYAKKSEELNGYVYSDRYKLISTFASLIISQKTDTSILLKNDSVDVIITQSKFNRKKHRFKYVKNYPTQIELIDNKKYWGTDGGMPTTQFEKIIIKVGKKIIVLPKIAVEGLYEPSLHHAEVNYDKTTNTFYIQTMNSDGAGSYYVIWKVEKGVYKERLVAYGF